MFVSGAMPANHPRAASGAPIAARAVASECNRATVAMQVERSPLAFEFVAEI
jgi:hypothetical protein